VKDWSTRKNVLVVHDAIKELLDFAAFDDCRNWGDNDFTGRVKKFLAK
jgi:hypothetical protein